MAVTLRYFTEVRKPALQKTICGGIYARVYCILVRVQCRHKESSRSLSHLLMSFLFYLIALQSARRPRVRLSCLQRVLSAIAELLVRCIYTKLTDTDTLLKFKQQT